MKKKLKKFIKYIKKWGDLVEKAPMKFIEKGYTLNILNNILKRIEKKKKFKEEQEDYCYEDFN